MGVPSGISSLGKAAYFCGKHSIKFTNPKYSGSGGRQQLTRDFHGYLEVAMQAKHDSLMVGYCKSVQVAPRKQAGNQIQHGKNATATGVLNNFYPQKAVVAAEVVCDQMIKRWKNQSQTQPEFTPGVRIDASVQSIVQRDLYRYEISYWYDGQDIYVLFHCYPK